MLRAMGDVKTPDFDDLLAAFDIPDIDAKEAIQSSPAEEQHEVGANTDEGSTGSPSCFPNSLVFQSDPPVVSVIVKNTVRSESFEEEKSVRDKTDNPSSSGINSHAQVRFGDLLLQHGPKIPVHSPVEPEIANGFEGSAPSNQGQSSTPLWPQGSPLRSTLKVNEGDSNKGVEVGSVKRTADGISGLKPLHYLQSSTSVCPNPSVSLSPRTVSPQHSPHYAQKEETCLSSPSSPLPQNGSVKAGAKRVMHSDEEESEPDLGSPLVIQESPESVMSSPPKFKYRAKLRCPELLVSPEPPPHFSLPASAKPEAHPEEKEKLAASSSLSTTPQPQSPQDCHTSVSTDSASVQKEKYPEHVIDERDSPESPPPSEMGLVPPKRSSSPDSSESSGLPANHKDIRDQEGLMESEVKELDRPGDTREQGENLPVDGGHVKEDKCGADTQDPVSGRAEETVSPSMHPLKVKIKMNSGSITKTMSGITPKRSGRATLRAVNSSKPSPEHNTRSKRELSQESQMPAVTTIQEGVTSMKDKIGGTVDPKPHVSPTAVNITRTAALPSVSAAFPRVSPGRNSPCSLGLKSLSTGPTLTAPSPLLLPQSSSKPASIVNSTGAIISKSQTNLVEAFNKILNNRNLLPSYKPDLSAPLPAEWGLPLPAQVNFIYLFIYLSLCLCLIQLGCEVLNECFTNAARIRNKKQISRQKEH